MIDTRDVAGAATAILLANKDKLAEFLALGRVQLHGPELKTFADKAAALSKACGKEIAVNAVPPDAWVAAMVGYGLLEDFARSFKDTVSCQPFIWHSLLISNLMLTPPLSYSSPFLSFTDSHCLSQGGGQAAHLQRDLTASAADLEAKVHSGRLGKGPCCSVCLGQALIFLLGSTLTLPLTLKEFLIGGYRCITSTCTLL